MRLSDSNKILFLGGVVALITGCSAARAVAAQALPLLAPTSGIAGDRAQAAREANENAAKTDKLAVEADANLQVENVEAAAAAVRDLVKEQGGKIISDEVLREANIASFVLRLPPAELDAFFVKLDALGEIKHRRIKIADVTKQYTDTEIELDNLTQALNRYQEILKSATKVEEMLAVEQQLTRVRTEIEKLKGTQAYLADRVALATMTVSISPIDRTPVFAPQAKFHPGVSAIYLAYMRPGHRPEGYFGPGFSLQLARYLHFDIAVLKDAHEDAFADDALTVTMGGEVYSDFLGRGKLTFFNPFFGFNLGWVRVAGVDFASGGGALGIELIKTTHVLVDAAVKSAVLVNRYDVRMAVQPQLTVNVAF